MSNGHYDIIIIGSGAGGGTLARHLAPSGKSILLLERGDWLKREPENWSAEEVFVKNRYVSIDTWRDKNGKPFQPGVHILTPIQVDNCRGVATAAQRIATLALSDEPNAGQQGPKERAAWVQIARHLRVLRHRILTGRRDFISAIQDPLPSGKISDAEKILIEMQRRFDVVDAFKGSRVDTDGKKKPVPVPEFTDSEFATRATVATMACYLFASLADWSGIHTCMITCVVTALSTAASRTFKQRLRIVGAAIGGILGVMAVVLFIPNMNNLTGVLIILAVGIAISAWVMMGREKFSYAGLQMAVAFSMTVLQEPHAATELHVIRDRMVGIFLGIIAMRVAFVIGTEMKSKNSIASATFSLTPEKRQP